MARLWARSCLTSYMKQEMTFAPSDVSVMIGFGNRRGALNSFSMGEDWG